MRRLSGAVRINLRNSPECNFGITEEVAAILRKLPEFELFDFRLHVLKNITPGTDPKDAPRCFAIKLKRATHNGFGAKPTTHDPS